MGQDVINDKPKNVINIGKGVWERYSEKSNADGAQDGGSVYESYQDSGWRYSGPKSVDVLEDEKDGTVWGVDGEYVPDGLSKDRVLLAIESEGKNAEMLTVDWGEL